MKNFFKGKFGTIMVLFTTLILAGIAIFTAMRLYQLRQQPVAPNVPSSFPQAQEVTQCQALVFTVGATPTESPTASPTGSPTESPTASPTGTPSPTPTGTPGPTPTPTPVAQCNASCAANTDCPSNLICYIASGATTGSCRSPQCQTDSNCICSDTTGGTGAPVAGEPTLPQSGTSWPTIIGAGLGILVVLGSLLLAL